MKTKTTMTLVFGLISILAVVTIFLSINILTAANKLKSTSETRYQSYQVADELRQSSDDLTRLARTYSLTGDAGYEKMYLDILAIRNGEKPLPQKYHQIYWDLVLEYGQKPKPDGQTISIQQRMQDLGFSEKEFALLKEAQANSDALVNLEVKAMNAVKGIYQDPTTSEYTVRKEPNFTMAAELLHSKTYHSEKAKIMAPIDSFFSELEARTLGYFEKDFSALYTSVIVMLTLMGIMVSAAIVGFFAVNRSVSNPVTELSKTLGEISKSRNFDLRVQDLGKGEVANIGQQINTLLESLAAANASRDQVSKQVSQLAQSSANSVTACSQGAEALKKETYAVVVANEEMSTALYRVAEVTREAEQKASSSDAKVINGENAMKSALNAMQNLQTEFSNSQSAMSGLISESAQVSGVLDVIKSIAEQTNLLALNAAIEAARAGEQGRGFAVVADEVRSLAQRTQDSTNEIEEIIASLQQKTNSMGDSINQAASLMENSSTNIKAIGEVFKEIKDSTQQIYALNSEITASTEEQSRVSQSISESLSQINNLTLSVASSIAEVDSSVNSLNSSARNLGNSAA